MTSVRTDEEVIAFWGRTAEQQIAFEKVCSTILSYETKKPSPDQEFAFIYSGSY